MGGQAEGQDGHLQKRFSKITMLGMAFAILNTWISLAGSIGLVMPSGGSVSFVYGFIFCVLCNICLSASVGELASIYPTAGGQYHYAYALSMQKWKKPMSFFVGWINIAGWLTLNTTAAYFGARFLAAAAVAGSGGTYEITKWSTYLMFVAVSIIGVFLNIFGYPILNRWNEGALYWSLLSVIVISIVLLSTSPKTDASFVFTNFSNTTGWSDGTAWMLGLLQSALSFIGYDAVAHMTEEMPRPTKDAPQAMVGAVLVGGITGIVFILVMLFCAVDIDVLLASPTQSPLTEIILQATKSRAAAIILSVAVALCFVNGANGCVTSGSRLVWAMARDNGTPFSRYLSHLHPKLNVPVRAIVVQAVFNLLFGLLYLGPEVAFNAYIASCTLFLNLSYALPVMILLVRGRRLLSANPPEFSLGQGILGYVTNWVAVLFVLVTSVFFCFPPAIPIDISTMNYVTAVIGIFIVYATVLWTVKRKTYNGPKFDLILGEELPVNNPNNQGAIVAKGSDFDGQDKE
ncbi:choline transport protein (amino acid permease) [Colletotrichum truncatum]|uniref:Choline transport protein (Amino acid permease) n=1 Tax=Colletotrichum truncatum TaxID=5467 RepID=A0ACC3YZ65_COLTU|nr:choline transport protein (amino acid permease) [Colletotrichum truncatum]KAF6786347.1 choline transport protein (amino acid permease) [Colletotrichum truncatum]